MEKLEKIGNVAKKGLNKSLARNIVVKVTEALIPLIFWGGMIVITIQSLVTAYYANQATFNYWNGTNSIVVFLILFLSESLTLIVSLYLIYLLKDIRDALFSINDKQKVEDEQ